jgi:hypothetical protein
MTVLRNPTVPVAASGAAVEVDQIHWLPERIAELEGGDETVTLLPHDPEPKRARTVAAPKFEVSGTVGNVDGIVAETDQLASETVVSLEPSLYVTWIEAKNPGAGAPASLLFTAKTATVFVDAFNEALKASTLNACPAFQLSAPEAPIGCWLM